MLQRQISEADWKLLRRLQPIALDRFCHGVLSEVARLASDTAKGSHARYLQLFQLIEDRDEELGAAFNDSKRSTALMQLARMRSLRLLTDDEFEGFNSETRSVVSSFLEGQDVEH
jgi:hypothetical protein